MFETIAVMEGDYDTGKTKLETMKDYFGEEGLKEFKTKYPDKFKYLVGMGEE